MTTIMLITVLVAAAAMLTLQLRAHRVARTGRAPQTAQGRRPSRTPPGLHDGWLEPVGGDRR